VENQTSIYKKLNGLILVGGKSSRMGTNKAFLDFNGEPQVSYLTSLLRPFCNEVFVGAKKGEDYSELNVIEDAFGFDSPLNGILSAFQHSKNVAWLIVACDMPFIDAKSISFLIENRATNKLATCYINQLNEPEPLFCIWESASWQHLISFYNSGKYSPKKFLKENNVYLLPIIDTKTLTNINSKEDVEQYNLTINRLKKRN